MFRQIPIPDAGVGGGNSETEGDSSNENERLDSGKQRDPKSIARPGNSYTPPTIDGPGAEQAASLDEVTSVGDAYQQLKNVGAVDAVMATAALVGAGTLGVPATIVGGIGLTVIAGSAAYSWTNLACNLAGKPDTMKPYSGLFDPSGWATFAAAKVAGVRDELALDASRTVAAATGIVRDILDLEWGVTKAERARKAIESDLLFDRLVELGVLSKRIDPPARGGANRRPIAKPGTP